jgi:hypothetical protein
VGIVRAPSAISVIQNDVLVDFLAHVSTFATLSVNVYGPQDKDVNANCPAVLWYPGEESWLPSMHNGAPGSPSSLWVREVPFTFECFGGLNLEDDYQDERNAVYTAAHNNTSPTTDVAPPSTAMSDTDMSEALMARLVNSFHRRLTQHGYRIVKGGWSPSIRSGLGLVYILTVAIRMPLVREDNETVTIEHLTVNVEIDHAGD